MNDVHVFVSFDLEHDRELYEMILAQSRTQSSGFLIVGSSNRATAHSLCSEKTLHAIREANQLIVICEKTLHAIREANQLIVICGEHSESSASMTAELRVAQQEGKPYFLLWGRREIMCTKPAGAKSSEGMYSWTLPNLRVQMDLMTRSDKLKTPTDEFKVATKSKRSKGDPPST